MERLLKYLVNGKGIGLLSVIGLALLFWGASSIVFNNMIKSFLNQPTTTQLLEKLPEIEVKDGKIISPIVSGQTHTIPFDDGVDLTVVIDTQTSEKPVLNFEQGAYVTANTIYFKNEGGEQSLQLPNNLTQTITPEIFRDMLTRLSGYLSMILGLFPAVVVLLGFIIVYLFVLGFGILINNAFTFAQWGRTTAVSWIVTVLGFSGLFFITKQLNIVYVIAFAVIVSLILALKSKNIKN